ncbi:serine/threonine-protein kinase [Deinococcus sp.]|uniref:serine/threonine protein kinase n=1 Tax=Deinococcus sp. TaxID=47478 RepID=UPI0025BB2308|nr:serine/threonine-protein kinase [Deinococcus sp.]
MDIELSPLSPQAVLRSTEVLGQHGGVLLEKGKCQDYTVFIKTLVSEDPLTVARFEHEGQIVTALRHPLIIPCLRQTPTQLVFPFIPGGTLRDLARCGPMNPDAATSVVWGILKAVAYLHSRGVVHHDLKPENVMLLGGQPSARAVRIIDFGMSHAQHLPLDIHGGTRMGTPHFMAPEQFQGIRGDPRSDLYSVGVLLFDCLAGHPPYDDALGWLVGITENRAQIPGPAVLRPLILSALQRDLKSRPQTAGVMLNTLAQARASLGLGELRD